MNTPLPPVFAVYQKETNSFLFLESELQLYGSKYGFKLWKRPVKSCWKNYKESDRSRMMTWFQGQQWYCVPNLTQSYNLYEITLREKTYTYWRVCHELVWGDSTIQFARSTDWTKWPTIPVLEFNAKSLIPWQEQGVKPIWLNSSSDILLKHSEARWEILYRNIEEKNVQCETPIRIRVPVMKEIQDAISEELIPKPNTHCSVSRAASTCCECGSCCFMVIVLIYMYIILVRTAIGI
jgi:hypothetical protein